MYKRSNRVGLPALIAIALCFGTLLGALVYTPPIRVAGQSSVDDETAILQRVYQQVNPSVVNIRVRLPPGARNPNASVFGQIPQIPDTQSSFQVDGSGFVYDTQGNLVTSAQFVQEATRIAVTFADDTSLVATVVGIDMDSNLAIIKVDPSKVKLAALPLADSDKLVVGDRAIAIGNPFGLNGTMTHGIVSAVGRSLNGQRSGAASVYQIPQVIQTDAAINPGNAGGPLLNNAGEVIGVNTAIESLIGQSSGVSYAIPSNIVKKVADTLIKNGKIEHTYLGIRGGTLTLDVNELMGLDPNFRGILVRDVVPGSPAAQAGIKPSTTDKTLDGVPVKVGGDVIVAVDGVPVKRFEDLMSYLFVKTDPGQTVKITVSRDGQNVDLPVTLTKRPDA
jgi:S1-C subfamily serine protease